MPSMSDVVGLYMVSDEVASLSAASKKRRRIVLTAVLRVTGPTLPAHRLGRTHAEQVVAAWRSKGVSEATINSYKITLRNFGEYLFDSRYNRANPFKHLKTVKTGVNYAKRKPLTKAQIDKILKLADAFHPRDGICVRLALSTGLRESELVSLTWDDIDFDARVIRAARTKVHDTHTVPMSDQLHGHLTAWRATYEARCGEIQPQWYVVPALANRFHFQPDQRLRMVPTRKQTNLQLRLKKYFDLMKVDIPSAGSHTLRRTSANMLLEAGADVRDVMHLLGHRSEEMTSRYLDRDAGRAKLAEKMRDWRIG